MSHWIQTNLVSGDPDNLTKPFRCSFSTRAQQHLNFDDACDFTAQAIAKTYSNLYLAFSGGLDSVHVANVFVRNRIDFVPIILEDLNTLIDPDTWWAHHWCKENGITPLIFQLNKENYDHVARRMLWYSVKHQLFYCQASYIKCFLTEVLPADAALITGDGEPFQNSTHYNEICSDDLELLESCYHMQVMFGDRHPGGFFTYTPELLWSMVTHARMDVNSQMRKALLYNLPFRPKVYKVKTTPAKFNALIQKFDKTQQMKIHLMPKKHLLDIIG